MTDTIDTIRLKIILCESVDVLYKELLKMVFAVLIHRGIIIYGIADNVISVACIVQKKDNVFYLDFETL